MNIWSRLGLFGLGGLILGSLLIRDGLSRWLFAFRGFVLRGHLIGNGLGFAFGLWLLGFGDLVLGSLLIRDGLSRWLFAFRGFVLRGHLIGHGLGLIGALDRRLMNLGSRLQCLGRFLTLDSAQARLGLLAFGGEFFRLFNGVGWHSSDLGPEFLRLVGGSSLLCGFARLREVLRLGDVLGRSLSHVRSHCLGLGPRLRRRLVRLFVL